MPPKAAQVRKAAFYCRKENTYLFYISKAMFKGTYS